MKKLLKWLGIIVLIVIVVGVVAFFSMKSKGGEKLTATHHAHVAHLTLSTDSAVLARGEHLTNVLCRECHGPNLAGMAMIDDEGFGKLYAPNLTQGEGGIASWYDMEAWDRSIRHGIRHDSTTLMIMPSISFQNLSDGDLQAIVSYIYTVEPIDDVVPDREFVPFIQFLIGAGAFDNALQATLVEHDFTNVPEPDHSDRMAYGDYLHRIAGCNHCHGADMAGAHDGDPDGPPAPNITPGGNLGNWTMDEFIIAIREGKTPEGKEMNPMYMPWNSFKNFTDQELEDIYNYIQSQPALESKI